MPMILQDIIWLEAKKHKEKLSENDKRKFGIISSAHSQAHLLIPPLPRNSIAFSKPKNQLLKFSKHTLKLAPRPEKPLNIPEQADPHSDADKIGVFFHDIPTVTNHL